jgi:hypothetical protein
MFGPPSAPRGAPPASSTPLRDYLSHDRPGVDEGYVVIPRPLAESMPLPWQQQLTSLLGRFHEQHADLAWPAYRVVPSRPELLVDLDEEQLAEAGYLVEIDADGELVYRERGGRRVDDPEHTTVLVSCLDPIARTEPDQLGPDGRGAPAPMNIGPQPVWRATTPPGARQVPPPLPAPARAASVSSTPAGQPWGTEPQDAAPPHPEGPGDRSADEPPDGSSDPPEPEGTEFGPTGEPTEIPYRYRR